jgi:hypothetical protein
MNDPISTDHDDPHHIEAGRAERRRDEGGQPARPPREEIQDIHPDVDDTSEASFPASDPPAWMGMPPGGPPRPRGASSSNRPSNPRPDRE